MGKMKLTSFSIDENVIKENQYKMTEERMEDMIHETLKSGGSITRAKGHEQELIVTLVSLKCSLGMSYSFICTGGSQNEDQVW